GRYPAHCPAEFGLSSHLRLRATAGGRLACCELSILTQWAGRAGKAGGPRPLPVRFLRDLILLEFLVEVAPWCIDGFGGLGDVPPVLPELGDEVAALGRVLELAQRRRLPGLRRAVPGAGG